MRTALDGVRSYIECLPEWLNGNQLELGLNEPYEGHVYGGQVEQKSKVYHYQTTVKWTEQRKGVMSCDGKPEIQVATPPEFKGHEGIWSPEDLFVASANICLMTTFLAVAERAGLAFSAYESTAKGRLELVEGQFQFTAITIRPSITLKSGEDAVKARELIEKAERNCLISNSMKATITLEPVIR